MLAQLRRSSTEIDTPGSSGVVRCGLPGGIGDVPARLVLLEGPYLDQLP